MNVSSVSSYSGDLWEEYLEQLKKKQLQENAETAQESPAAGNYASGLSPDQILSELQGIQGGTEELKERAAELAAQVAEEAETAVGMRADMLNELAGDLEIVAESGDLSVIQEKLARGPHGAPGASDISSKLALAALEEEDDDEISASTLEGIKSLLSEIQKLIEKEEAANSYAETSASTGFEGLVSKFRSIRESNAAESSGASSVTELDSDIEASIDSLLEKVRANLTNQLQAVYTQVEGYSSSVSLSG
ncbi:MAG: hypothetical protein LBS45_02690 [Synergistaceae bacterium]|nr:hypothetical protein [Synergistaceae bacterium]